MVFHVTTPKKVKRYEQSGGILPPVRFWTTIYSALKWSKKTGRSVILTFEQPDPCYPLPIKGGAMWTDKMIREYKLMR